MKRCKWCNLKNQKYVCYHDFEWGKLNLDDHYLFEMLILEMFSAGLSWQCILNKRESFKKAYDDFDIDKIVSYDKNKINQLMSDESIVRNKLKIKYSIENAKIFKNIQKEYSSFKEYLLSFTNGKIIYESGKTTNELSNSISKDLYKRGMRFVGSVMIYSYLCAIGLINAHDEDCFLFVNR